MKSVAAHLEECLELAQPLERFDAELPDAIGCVLAEDVRSTLDVPNADMASCDGYAVKGADTIGASPDRPATVRVTDEIFADSLETFSLLEGTAVRIASGARMPKGADAVVPLDSTDQHQVEVTIFQSVRAGDYVRQRSEDIRAGDTILEKGTRLAARHIALLAAAGWAGAAVRPAPRVVVMSVGNELVAPGRAVPPGKVYDANSHALAAAVKSAGGVAYRVPAVTDEKAILREALEDQLLRADVIITTGGLSYGGGDTIKDVLLPLGSVRFDNVSMTPGRQLGVGKLEDGTVIFCLPGDPVKALVAFEVFVRPCLRKMAGYANVTSRVIKATAKSSLYSEDGVRDFVLVQIEPKANATFDFAVTQNAERNLLSGLARSNGLAVVPENVTRVRPGDELECMIFKG